MADIAWAAISGGSQVVRKSITINSSQNWVAPVNLAGNQVWLTGTAGGGSGGVSASNTATGGASGCFCDSAVVPVTAGSTYAVVIGAGGATNGNAGGNTTFGGTLLVLNGGSAGKSIDFSSSPQDAVAAYMTPETGGALPVKPLCQISAGPVTVTGLRDSQQISGNAAGQTLHTPGGQNYRTGGAAGKFGSGTAASVTSSAGAGAGSGAGSGAAATSTGTGGTGKLIIEWDEFL